MTLSPYELEVIRQLEREFHPRRARRSLAWAARVVGSLALALTVLASVLGLAGLAVGAFVLAA